MRLLITGDSVFCNISVTANVQDIGPRSVGVLLGVSQRCRHAGGSLWPRH